MIEKLLTWLFPVQLPRFTADELKHWPPAQVIELPSAEWFVRAVHDAFCPLSEVGDYSKMEANIKASGKYWPGDRTS